MNVDATHKENISYINNEIEKISSSEFSLEDIYMFVKNDLKFATYTEKQEDEEENEVITEEDVLNGNIFNTVKKESQLELGFLGQDLSNNEISNLVANKEIANRHNIAISCNESNYINVLAGALQYAIHKIDKLESIIIKENNL